MMNYLKIVYPWNKEVDLSILFLSEHVTEEGKKNETMLTYLPHSSVQWFLLPTTSSSPVRANDPGLDGLKDILPKYCNLCIQIVTKTAFSLSPSLTVASTSYSRVFNVLWRELNHCSCIYWNILLYLKTILSWMKLGNLTWTIRCLKFFFIRLIN